ncbi:putative kelch-type beta propeller [Helianthus debilis subsp. tardiflorus]
MQQLSLMKSYTLLMEVVMGDTYLMFRHLMNDARVLDLKTMTWSVAETIQTPPAPWVGHAGVSINEKWFLVGGGDNKNGTNVNMNTSNKLDTLPIMNMILSCVYTTCWRCFRDIGDRYAQACYLGFDECKWKTPTC